MAPPRRLDETVAAAYGWPADLPDEAILDALVALNGQRAAEETQGDVRWLRPAYQAPEEVAAQREWADLAPEAEEVQATKGQRPWPETLSAQITALRDLLAALPGPATAAELARAFQGRRSAQRVERIEEILATLHALGHIQLDPAGGYRAD